VRDQANRMVGFPQPIKQFIPHKTESACNQNLIHTLDKENLDDAIERTWSAILSMILSREYLSTNRRLLS